MEFREVLRRRRTVRHCTDRPLEPEVVERVLDAALRAPSAGSSQGEAFPLLTRPADRARSCPSVRARATQPTMTDVPLVVVPLSPAEQRKGVEERRRPEQDVVHRGRW